MRIDGERVLLEPFVEHHLHHPRYLAWLRDRGVMRLIGREEYLRPFEFTMVIDYVESLWANPRCSFWAVHARDDGQFIGTFKLNFDGAPGHATSSADVGIMIGERSRWNSGLATDALRAGCKHAFESDHARKLTAGANASNGAVIAAFLKIGFREEGRLRAKLLTDGVYRDHVLMGCFPDELAATQPALPRGTPIP